MPSVDRKIVTLLHDYLRSIGIEHEHFLEAVPEEQESISIAQWQRMLKKSSDESGRIAFGLDFAQYIGWQDLGVVGYLSSSCETVGEAFQRGFRLGRLTGEMNPGHWNVDENTVAVSWPLLYGPSGPLLDQLGLGCLVNILRQLIKNDFAPLRVDFIEATPTSVDAYLDFFRCPAFFDQPEPKVVFDRKCLDFPMLRADHNLRNLLEAHAEELLQKFSPVGGELGRLREQLQHLILEGGIRLEDLAQHNNINPRTLQRRLKESGSSFQQLLDDTRRVLAEQYLSDSRRNIVEIAVLLGYTEQSSFTRACRLWTGKTPREWRKNLISKNMG